MSTKLAFFDIDGTLSAPYYPVNGVLQAGMTDEQWLEFCRTYREDSYHFCKPVMPVIRYARELRCRGAELYVLSTSQTKEEDLSKEHIIAKWCPDLFREILTVRKDSEKTLKILEIADALGVDPAECELVEDTYSLVLDAIGKGIKGTHVAQIVCDL
ncbi:MAG: hypothetical protein J5643_10845 [Lachnospiraceae bacterium]|nr:hypothetical protein [Lachnospiraceae bacterium]